MNALGGAFNQEKPLVGAFSVIVKSSRRFVDSSSVVTTETEEKLWPDTPQPHSAQPGDGVESVADQIKNAGVDCAKSQS